MDIFHLISSKVIIVSTVRSTPEYVNTDNQYKLGFLANPKVTEELLADLLLNFLFC